jgi:photosystem II stability/assembly factor-like uncharacterized protein
VIESPTRPTEPDELELLIREARDRQRRRRVLLAAGVAAAAALGLALWAAIPGGGTVVVRQPGGAVGVASSRLSGAPSRFRGIGTVGTGGGVTWAINGRGFWLTEDGGRTWLRVHLPGLASGGVADGRADPLANVSDVQFVDLRHGWVSTMAGSGIYRTTDGGRSWRVSIPPGCAAVCEGGAVSFLDARNGYALVDTRAPDNRLFRTVDGGRTWRLVSQPTVFGPVTFADSTHGFAFGPGGQMVIGPYAGVPFGMLYETSDGGRTWSRPDLGGSDSYVEEPLGAFGRSVVLVQNRPNPRGAVELAAGSIYSSGDVDGRWRAQPVPSGFRGGWVPTSLSLVSPRIWILSFTHVLLVTADAGRHWRKLVVRNLPRGGRIKQVAFSSSRVGWAVLYGFGSQPALFHTTDGGVHWKPAGPRLPRRHGRG